MTVERRQVDTGQVTRTLTFEFCEDDSVEKSRTAGGVGELFKKHLGEVTVTFLGENVQTSLVGRQLLHCKLRIQKSSIKD
jgi:hypothetical protein